MRRSALALLAASAAGLALTPALAQASVEPAYQLFGEAELVKPGYKTATAAQLSGDVSKKTYGGVEFSNAQGLTVSQLTNLSTEYQITAGNCGLGSPRFVAEITNGVKTGYVEFDLGPYPEYTKCPQNEWTNTGNLASPSNLVNIQSLGGGAYEEYSKVQAKYGTWVIAELFLRIDNGEESKPQTAQFDNVKVNTDNYEFQPAALGATGATGATGARPELPAQPEPPE